MRKRFNWSIAKVEGPQPFTPCEEHTWVPRGQDCYTCSVCRVRGYARRRQRKLAWGKRRDEIVPYACPKCGGPTIWPKRPCPSCG